jgi:hypothetical protein
LPQPKLLCRDPEHTGSALNLDEDLERAAIEVFKATDRP